MPKSGILAVIVALATVVVGCFNEPEPAYKSVPAGARIYKKNAELVDLRAFSAENWGRDRACTDEIDYLNLDRNKLVNVDEITGLVGLKWLRLNDNALESLPDISKLQRLRRIYLRNNRLKEVPIALKDLPELTDIDLSGNPISEIPAWLAEKEGLENLAFNGTKITKLPENLQAWRSLKSLQLGDLNLSTNEMARIRAVFAPEKNPLGTAVVF